MKKMFALVIALVIAVCALSIFSITYDTTPDVVISGGEIANAIATSSADTCTHDRQDYPIGANAENQYDILADNDLYGHADYGDYVPAEVRYVDGFPTVDGEKTYSRYYEDSRYVQPAEEEKPREDWNMHDFHANGEMFETVGNGTMSFYSEEDRDAYIASLKEEFGEENVHEYQYDSNGNASSSTGNGLIDQAQNTVDDVNEKQGNIEDILNSMG
ncbi:MAG: hypothetical protein J5877_02955 [Clostridia bacterium]|nr:hypothetical protein [Clostridia bacterium]